MSACFRDCLFAALGALLLFPLWVAAQTLPESRNTYLPELTCGAAPCLFPNVQLSYGGGSGSSVVATNPNTPAAILVAGEVYNCATLLGVFSSEDGGASWSHDCLPLHTGGEGIGGPIAGYDSNG